MAKKLLLLLGLILGAVFFASDDVFAAESMRVLQPGNTYEFTGLNPGLISHVNIVGGGRYGFVETNSDGEITRFGFSDRRITISGTGRVAVTPVAPMQVSFDAGRIRISVSVGQVLTSHEVLPGQTISLNSNSNIDGHVRVSLNTGFYYDFAIFCGFGETVGFDFDSRFPQIGLPAGGLTVITAGYGSLTVYFPTKLLALVSWPGVPVLSTQVVVGGFQTGISNESSSPRDFAVRTFDGTVFRYAYVLRGADGHTVRYGSASGNSFRVPPGSSLYITPVVSATIFFPSKLDIGVFASGNVPAHNTLMQGETIVVANTNTAFSHRIFATSSTAFGYFSLDYVLYDNGSYSWGMAENVTAEWGKVLEPGAKITITITQASTHTVINVPSVDGVSAWASDASATIRHYLNPGESVYVVNNSRYFVDVLFSADNLRLGPDYVRYDSGEVESFGRAGTSGFIELRSDESVLITSTLYPVVVAVPRVLTGYGLSALTSDRQALMRVSLRGGEALQIDNVAQRFNRAVIIEDDTWHGTRAFMYDFTLTQITNAANYTVFDFGVTEPGLHVMPPRSRLSIFPDDRAEMSAAFPAEWHDRIIRTRFVSTAPLHRQTLAPGRSLTLRNTTNYDLIIANNSRQSGAGFHVRRPGESTSIPASEAPQTGYIVVGARETIVVVAARGANLEMWMPRSVARQLGLAR